MTYKVLIVDDSKLARMAVVRALRSCGPAYDHVEAGSADEALSAVEQAGPQIALVDFNMPGVDGLRLVAELRNLNPSMPIALISANSQQEVVQRAAALKATFLPKPLTAAALGGFLETAAAELDRS